MRSRGYFLLAILLLLILGVFLTLGIINSRITMMDLIKEEARAFLSTVALTQETSIFAESKFEDVIIEKLINICNNLDAIGLNKNVLEKTKENFNLNSIIIYDAQTKAKIVTAGFSLNTAANIFTIKDNVFFDYFNFGRKKYLSFVYRKQNKIFKIEVLAEEIESFRQQFGINKIINQISLNPMVKFLLLQDRLGIIFATPNIQTISSIDEDSMLIIVLQKNTELSRIIEFDGKNVLELIRPFMIEGKSIGLYRIGINLENYYHHVSATARQLILLFVILFGVVFVLLFLFMKYQSYIGLKDLFAKTLGAVEDAILMVNKAGAIHGVNKMFANLSSFEERMLLNGVYFSLFKDDPFDVRKVLKEANKVVNEKVIFGKNIQYTTYPLLDEKNMVSGTISVLRDVTKIREFEKEREEAERLKFLGNLVANFAHEIKNPLNGLSIATQRLIKEFPAVDKEYLRIMTTIKNEIESLNKTLNDFLILARPRIKEKSGFNLSDLLHDTLDIIREQLKSENIILKESIEDNIKFTGYEEDFKRAILNILLNAIDAVMAITERTREITIGLCQTDERIELIIADNGVGMDDEEKERVFTPYFTTKKGGTGLGLYIAQKIIRENRGEIKIIAAKNLGTRCQITFR